jgi:hypothetical protein
LVLIVGVDPGLRGGVAVLDGAHARCEPLPVRGGRVDVSALLSLLPSWQGCAFVEQPFVRRGQAGVLTMCANYGRVLAALELRGYSVCEVSPRVWQRRFGISGETKGQSLRLSAELYPEVGLVPRGGRVPHDGMSDALLIASYGKGFLEVRC